ncbi:hypothetical protein FACS1894167_07850 [Synergistales bacterium]|nr:hypothetical protein FACS1894167_07850 [Synergistales bacterium]GHV50535.1 hypothetical protein FACS1894216_02890 [Synergistales bacterium]
MRDMILNTNILPNPLLGLIRSPQMRVRETDKGIIIMPVESNTSLDTIKKARGMYTDGKLSVDKFLSEKHIEEAGR